MAKKKKKHNAAKKSQAKNIKVAQAKKEEVVKDILEEVETVDEFEDEENEIVAKKNIEKNSTKAKDKKKSQKEEIEEKSSISLLGKIKDFFKSLKIKKAGEKIYSVTRNFLIVSLVVVLLVFSGGYILGLNFDVRDLFADKNTNNIQDEIAANLKIEAGKLSEALGYKLEDPWYNGEGTVEDMELYQYVAYVETDDAYVAWLADKYTGEIKSIWTASQKPSDGSNMGATIASIILDLYKDRIPSELVEEIKNSIQNEKDDAVTGDEFIYLQQFNSEDIDEGYDYLAFYEFDFFDFDLESLNITTDNTEKTVEGE